MLRDALHVAKHLAKCQCPSGISNVTHRTPIQCIDIQSIQYNNDPRRPWSNNASKNHRTIACLGQPSQDTLIGASRRLQASFSCPFSLIPALRHSSRTWQSDPYDLVPQAQSYGNACLTWNTAEAVKGVTKLRSMWWNESHASVRGFRWDRAFGKCKVQE